jgi:hypothetical protein
MVDAKRTSSSKTLMQGGLMRWHFRILALFGMVGLPAVFMLHRGQAQSNWRPASQMLSIDFQQQILKENLQPGTSIEIGQMKVLTAGRLQLIDTHIVNPAKTTNTNPLCGAESCLFLGYSNRKRVLNIYLNPNLPPKVTLIQLIDEQQETLPCLLINQLQQQKIHTAKLCFNGTIYETVETQILPEVYE